MIDFNEEETLRSALEAARMAKLPSELSAETEYIWLKAIVKVRKCNGRANYAIGMNNGAGKPVILEDFGIPAKIVRIEGIYPFLFTDTSAIPDIRNKGEILAYIDAGGLDAELAERLMSPKKADGTPKEDEKKKSDREKVKRMVYFVALKTELNRLDNLEKPYKLDGKTF